MLQAIYRTILGGLLSAALTLPAGAESRVVLSLMEAQEQALQGNQMLNLARAGVDQARAARLQSRAGFLPSFTVSEQALRSNDAVNAFGFKLKQENFAQTDFAIDALNRPAAATDFQTTFQIQQPVFNGGQALYGRRQAGAGVRAAAAQLVRGQQEVVLHTAVAYWGLVLARGALQAVQQGLETARAHVAVAQAHYEQQTVPLTDLLAAQVRVAELRNEEITAANRVAAAADGLSLVLGLDSQIEVVPADSLEGRRVGVSLEELVAAGQQRPDLMAMKHQAAAARHGVKVARAAHLPHLNGFVRVDLDADAPFARQGESWTVGALVTWNLFAGFRTIGAVQQAKAQVAQAEARTAFLQGQTEREVRQACRQVEAAHTQIEVAAGAVEQAEERLRISRLQYQEGLVTGADLLDAETVLTQALIRRLQALHALNVGVAQLEFAAGVRVD